MNILKKFVNFFKTDSISVPVSSVQNINSEIYKKIKEDMDNFEKNAVIENVRLLTITVKGLTAENQVLTEVIKNQNEAISNLVIVTQQILSVLHSGVGMEDIIIDEEYVDEDYEEDITETSSERSNRELSKKFGAN